MSVEAPTTLVTPVIPQTNLDRALELTKLEDRMSVVDTAVNVDFQQEILTAQSNLSSAERVKFNQVRADGAVAVGSQIQKVEVK